MSAEKLFALGAEPVGGVVYLKRAEVGRFTPSGFVLTPAGEAALAEAPAEAAPAPAPARKTKAAKAVDPAAVNADVDDTDLDALLNG